MLNHILKNVQMSHVMLMRDKLDSQKVTTTSKPGIGREESAMMQEALAFLKPAATTSEVSHTQANNEIKTIRS
jgi:hypothetical protein